MGLMHYLLRHLGGRAGEPRFVRRVEVHCPRTSETVQIELEMAPTGRPAKVLRCSARPEAPPTCDQCCRRSAEAVLHTPLALLLVPPGEGPPDEPC